MAKRKRKVSRKKDNSFAAAIGIAVGIVLIFLGLFNITAFIVSQDPTPPFWWDQSQAYDSVDQGGQNTLSACWNDTETYVPKAKLETTVDGETATTPWQDTVPVTTTTSVKVAEYGPVGDPSACQHTDCEMLSTEYDRNTCNSIFNPDRPDGPHCECWCTQTIVLCNSSTFVYDVPEDTCGPVSWRIFGQDVSGNEDVTDSMSFGVNDITDPIYGSQKQSKVEIEAGGSNNLSVVCMDDCGLSKATLWTKENTDFAESDSQDISGTEQEVVFEWSNPALSEQEVEWKIACEDAQGQSAESSVLSFSIGEAADTEAPVLVSADVDNDSPLKGDTVTFTATWSDNEELSSAQLEINGAVVSTKSLSGTEDTATFTWTATEAGQFTWLVKASDKSGNSASSDTSTISIRGLCPACPDPTDWGKCIKGQQTRTNYKCGAETNYVCQAYIETMTCAVPVEGMPLWLIGSIIAVIAGIIIVAFVMLKKPAAAAIAKPPAPKTSRL
ncbi:MAG: hypothetical protein ACE5J7_03725 [Candidatus Aenigmatarchaeota archaeon]